MPAYALGFLRYKDPAAYQRYSTALNPLLPAYGGVLLAGDNPPVGLAGPPCDRVTPAPTVTAPSRTSTGPNSSRRVSTRTTSPPSGTAPPTSPVLPPCGTTATPASRHARRTPATSAAFAGRTAAHARPR